VATLSTNVNDQYRIIVSNNVPHFVKICQVLTILNQLIYRGITNFGTRCSYFTDSTQTSGNSTSDPYQPQLIHSFQQLPAA